MKRLISAQDVEAAAKAGAPLSVDGNTIVTPQAKDLARELGVELCSGCTSAPVATAAAASAASAPASAASKAPATTAPAATVHDADPALTADQMERVIRAALDRGIWTPEKLETLFGGVCTKPTATIGVSGRHIHLSQEHLETLFGKGHELTPIKELSQPGQFAAKETVTLVGPKGVIERVRVLGPVRKQTQVEILAGDSFKLGVPAAVRMSGELSGTPGITLAGPCGTVAIPEGVIAAARHIHMSLEEAAARGLHDGQVVSIAFGGQRGGRLDNVVIRANATSALDCHIDTEEANALGLKNGAVVEIIR